MDELRKNCSVVTKWMLRLTLLLISPAFLIITLFSEQAIRVLFGAEYMQERLALPLL